jgi:hypothetical protein
LTDREALAGLERELGGTLAVVEGPVGAAEILDANVAVLEVNLCVATRRLRVSEDDVAGLSADRRHPGTDVAGLRGLVDVLNLENVVVRH